jgi:glycosyltransferase involved in cell wall biosynthesis
VIDDGSTDDTAQWLESVRAEATLPIRYQWQPNSGKHMAVKAGVRLARGDLCTLIDSDDWYRPCALARFVHHWDAIPDPALR